MHSASGYYRIQHKGNQTLSGSIHNLVYANSSYAGSILLCGHNYQ